MQSRQIANLVVCGYDLFNSQKMENVHNVLQYMYQDADILQLNISPTLKMIKSHACHKSTLGVVEVFNSLLISALKL